MHYRYYLKSALTQKYYNYLGWVMNNLILSKPEKKRYTAANC